MSISAIGLQLGAYFGYLKVDWARVHKDVHRAFDVNHDGYSSPPCSLFFLPQVTFLANEEHAAHVHTQ